LLLYSSHLPLGVPNWLVIYFINPVASDAKDANMASYHFYVQQLCGFFEGCEFHHVPRANNDEADQLSKIGSTKQDIPAGVSLEIIRKPSIKPSPESTSIYVPGDPAPAQAPPPDLRAAASGLKEAAG
jgi:hypothetical protein